MTLSLEYASESKPFKQEPADAGPTARRGKFRLDPAGPANLAFLWTANGASLYLDLNGNGDLTDDPEGVYKTNTQHSSSDFRYASFSKVRFPLQTSAGAFTWIADLNFNEFSRRLNVFASPRTFWAGKITFGERDYQVAVIPAVPHALEGSGHLLLRPATAATNLFQVQNGSLDAFPITPKFFLNDRQFQVSRRLDQQGDNPVCEIAFQEVPAICGRVELSGEFIDRLTLSDGSLLALFEQPKGSLTLPVATYTDCRVQLRKEQSVAFLDETRHVCAVSTETPATLSIGGPLTNTVAVSRRGDGLVLNYSLLGAGGNTYQLATRDYQNPPRFTARMDGREVASGKFEFG